MTYVPAATACRCTVVVSLSVTLRAKLDHTATVRVLQSPRANYLVVYQAEDREFAELEAVFEAMTASLVQQSAWLRESA